MHAAQREARIVHLRCEEGGSAEEIAAETNLAVCRMRWLGDGPSGNTVAGCMAGGRQPTPLRSATSIELNRRTVLATVTSHNPRFNRNIGIPISKIEPKNSTR